MPCPACVWDASRGQITALCQLHSIALDLTVQNRCIPFVLCISRDLSLLCLSRCPEMEHSSDCHPKSLILFKSNGCDLLLEPRRFPTLLYSVKKDILETLNFVRHFQKRKDSFHKFELYFVSVTPAFPTEHTVCVIRSHIFGLPNKCYSGIQEVKCWLPLATASWIYAPLGWCYRNSTTFLALCTRGQGEYLPQGEAIIALLTVTAECNLSLGLHICWLWHLFKFKSKLFSQMTFSSTPIVFKGFWKAFREI